MHRPTAIPAHVYGDILVSNLYDMQYAAMLYEAIRLYSVHDSSEVRVGGSILNSTAVEWISDRYTVSTPLAISHGPSCSQFSWPVFILPHLRVCSSVNTRHLMAFTCKKRGKNKMFLHDEWHVVRTSRQRPPMAYPSYVLWSYLEN